MGDGVPADHAQREVGADGGAPAHRGSSSSSGEPSSKTSACEQRREGGAQSRKRRRVGIRRGTSASDEEDECSEIADAINKFKEAYIKIETIKIESKKRALEQDIKIAALTREMKERRYKSVMETQLAMAKLAADAIRVAFDRCLDNRNPRDA